MYNFVVNLNDTNIKRLQTRHNLVVLIVVFIQSDRTIGAPSASIYISQRTGKHSDIAFNFEAEIVRYSVDNDAYVAGVASPTSPY